MAASAQEQADEALARRLQQEELRPFLRPQQQHGYGQQNQDYAAPLLQNQQGNNRQNQVEVRRVLVDEMQQAANESPAWLLAKLVSMLIEVITTAAVVSIGWNESCDKPLKWWLIVFTGRNLVLGPLRIYIYRHRNQPNDLEKPLHILRWGRIFTFLAFLLGQIFLFTSTNCRQQAPVLWTYTLIILVVFYVLLSLPFVVLICICLCLPCVLLVLRRWNPRGADETMIQNLPERTITADEIPTREGPEDVEQGSDDENEGPQCAICMVQYNEGDRVKTLPCDHEFHADCVDRWLPINKICPLCRHDITQPMNNPRRESNSQVNIAVDENGLSEA